MTDQNGHSKTGYSYDLLPVGGHFNEGLAKLNYTTAVKNFSGGSGISILGNNFVKDSLNYKVRIDLSDYAAKGTPLLKHRSTLPVRQKWLLLWKHLSATTPTLKTFNDI